MPASFRLQYSDAVMTKILGSHAVPFTVHVFKERSVYVAHAPELDVSTCGDTADEAQQNIKIAVRGFLQTAEERGALKEILEEAGYTQSDDRWLSPEFVSLDQVSVIIR